MRRVWAHWAQASSLCCDSHGLTTNNSLPAGAPMTQVAGEQTLALRERSESIVDGPVSPTTDREVGIARSAAAAGLYDLPVPARYDGMNARGMRPPVTLFSNS